MSYLIGNARYAEGKKVVQPKDSRDGFKGRASYLAEALGGRWVHRSHGYVMSPAAVPSSGHGHESAVEPPQAAFRRGLE